MDDADRQAEALVFGRDHMLGRDKQNRMRDVFFLDRPVALTLDPTIADVIVGQLRERLASQLRAAEDRGTRAAVDYLRHEGYWQAADALESHGSFGGR